MTGKGLSEEGAGGGRRHCLGPFPVVALELRKKHPGGGDSTSDGVWGARGRGTVGAWRPQGSVRAPAHRWWAGAASTRFLPSSAHGPPIGCSQNGEKDADQSRERSGHDFPRLAGSRFIFPLPRVDRECHLLWLWAPRGDHAQLLSWWSSRSGRGDAQETRNEESEGDSVGDRRHGSRCSQGCGGFRGDSIPAFSGF